MRSASFVLATSLFGAASAPLWAAEAPAATPAAVPAKAEEVALREDPLTHFWLLPIALEKQPGSVIVDSGADETSFDRGIAKKYGIQLRATDERVGGVGGTARMFEAKVSATVVGHERTLPLPKKVTFLDGFFDQDEVLAGKVGVLGLETLRAAGAVLDCAHGKLLLHSKALPFATPKGYAAVKACQATEHLLFVPVEWKGHAAAMLVDSGAQSSHVSPEFAKASHLELKKLEGAEARGVGGVEGGLQAGLLDGFKVGGLPVGNVPVLCIQIPPIGEDIPDGKGGTLPLAGILGIDQLRHLGAFVDTRTGRLYLPTAAPKESLPIFE